MRQSFFIFPHYSQLNGWGVALTTVTLFSLSPALTRLVIQAGVSQLEILLIRLGVAALLLPLEMFAGLLWAVWLLGESLTGWHALGGGLAALSAGIGVYAAGSSGLSKGVITRHRKEG